MNKGFSRVEQQSLPRKRLVDVIIHKKNCQVIAFSSNDLTLTLSYEERENTSSVLSQE